MLRATLTGVGLVVVALAITGVIKTGAGVVNGTESPQNLQNNINREFAEAGFNPAQSGQGRRGTPGRDTPTQADLDQQLLDRRMAGR